MKPEKFLRDFFRLWESSNGYRDALPRFMTKDCEYEIVGLSSTVGPVEAIALLDELAQKTGISSRVVEFNQMMADKNTLCVERLENLFDAKGRRLNSVRVMSIMEIKGQQIAAWRDYLDPALYREPKT